VQYPGAQSEWQFLQIFKESGTKNNQFTNYHTFLKIIYDNLKKKITFVCWASLIAN
jgi:hypothetical protein